MLALKKEINTHNDRFLMEAFTRLNVDISAYLGQDIVKSSPIDGRALAAFDICSPNEYDATVDRASEAFLSWRKVPAPARGELVRRFCVLVRENMDTLSQVLTLDCGKTVQEAAGEIQEVIDICDFGVGLSRQLYGLTIASERPSHRMMETWHPVGVFGQITAFNFPAAVWSWGAMIALVCGNSVVWKPSEKTPLTALALNGLMQQAINEYDLAPENLSQVVMGGADIGKAIASDRRIGIVSATGSTAMGLDVSVNVAGRMGRSILELGGNNAAIVTPDADMSLAVRGVTFSAVGTTGQRCTSMRRLIIHKSIADKFVADLKSAFDQLTIGLPNKPESHIGPLIDKDAYDKMVVSLKVAAQDGAEIWGGERVMAKEYPDAYYVKPAIVRLPTQTEIMRSETFAPILYVVTYETLDEAIAIQNSVEQGLSSAIFTSNAREAELFLSAVGSDCGIANVNIGTSGAEIGGAFGGEKMTGGGRAAGSDTWKSFMRRATNTINYSEDLPLSQGIEFGLQNLPSTKD